MIPTRRCSSPAPNPRRRLNLLCKLIPLRKAERLAKDPVTQLPAATLGLLQTAYPGARRQNSVTSWDFQSPILARSQNIGLQALGKSWFPDSCLVLTCSDLCYTSCFFFPFFLSSHLSCFLTFWLRQLMHACICTTPIIFLPVFLYTFFFLSPCACPGNENGWVWLSSQIVIPAILIGLRIPKTALEIDTQ